MDAHRIDVFDRADDDAVIRIVADDFHFILFPAENGFFDQHFVGRRNRQTIADDLFELFTVIGNAATFAAKGEAWADDCRKAGDFECLDRIFKGANHG